MFESEKGKNKMKRNVTAALGVGLLLLLSAAIFAYPAHPTPTKAAALGGAVAASSSSPYGLTITGSQFATVNAGTDFAHALHVSWARIQINMCDVFPKGFTGCKNLPITSYNPSDPNNYDWTIFDQDLMNAQANGLLVDFPLQHAPGGSYHGNLFQDPICSHPTAYVFQQYAKALLAHVQSLLSQGILAQGVLRAIEIGNEDWSFSSLGPQCENDAAAYAPIVEAVASTLRTNDAFMAPAPLIGSYGYTHFGLANAPGEPAARSVHTFWTTFFSYRDPRKPGDAGPGKLLDYVNVHYYHNNADPDTVIAPTSGSIYPYGQDSFAAVFGEMLQDAQAFKVVNHSKEPMPIWVTETGWALTDCNQTAAPVTASNQAVYEQKMLDEARQSNAHATPDRGAVTHLFLFSADEYSTNCGDNGMDISDHGIAQPAGVMLPAYVQSHPTWP